MQSRHDKTVAVLQQQHDKLTESHARELLEHSNTCQVQRQELIEAHERAITVCSYVSSSSSLQEMQIQAERLSTQLTERHTEELTRMIQQTRTEFGDTLQAVRVRHNKSLIKY